MIKVPRLMANRHGVFCLRIYYRDEAGKLKSTQQSLNTKDPKIARVMALQFNLSHELQRATAMPLNKPTLAQFAHLLDNKVEKYKIDLKNGIYEAQGAEDHRQMVEALSIIEKGSKPVKSAPVVQKGVVA